MDLFLCGSDNGEEKRRGGKRDALLTFSSDCLRPSSAATLHETQPSARSMDREDTAGLEEGEVLVEANRCFNCGCVGVNASDVAPVLLALDATIKTTKRILSAEAFFSAGGSRSGLLAPDELMVEIVIPLQPEGSRCAYEKYRIRRSIDFPIVSVATVFDLEENYFKDARIVLGAVAPVPVRAFASEDSLKGKAFSEDLAEQAAASAVEDAIPLGGNSYKIQIVKTLIKRAVISAGSEMTS
jgi:CO/xanthine dehydrogenase FAD-binding subunit